LRIDVNIFESILIREYYIDNKTNDTLYLSLSLESL